MSKINCNIFANVWDKGCSNTVTLTSVLKGIQNGRWKDLVTEIREAKLIGDNHNVKELKSRLPCVTWSGTFSERLDSKCVVYNKLMVVDIDGITKHRLKSLKEELLFNPYVYSYFESPSNGIKILMFIDSEEKDHSTHAFRFIENMFNEMYNIQIDKSGKNISRLCFVSWDETLYINPIPKVLEIEVLEEEKFFLEGFHKVNNGSETVHSTDSREIMKVCLKMIKKSKTGSYHKGNRNNYVFVLSCLLCEFGVNPEQAYGLISDRYPSLGRKETTTTVTSAYKRNKHKFGTKFVNERKNNKQQSIL